MIRLADEAARFLEAAVLIPQMNQMPLGFRGPVDFEEKRVTITVGFAMEFGEGIWPHRFFTTMVSAENRKTRFFGRRPKANIKTGLFRRAFQGKSNIREHFFMLVHAGTDRLSFAVVKRLKASHDLKPFLGDPKNRPAL